MTSRWFLAGSVILLLEIPVGTVTAQTESILPEDDGGIRVGDLPHRRELEQKVISRQQSLQAWKGEWGVIKKDYDLARRDFLQKDLKAKIMERGDSQETGLYYQETASHPLTHSGYFYDQAIFARKEAETRMGDLKGKLLNLQEKIRNQRRLVLEGMQRLKNYDQAVSEGWEQNPF